MCYSRLIFVCRCGQSAAQNVVFTLPKKPCCLVFSCSKSIPGAGRAKLLKSKYRGDVFMCLWSTPKADGREMRSQRIRQRPAGGSRGSWSAFSVYLSINIQELSGTKFNPCHGKPTATLWTFVVVPQSESRERKRTKRTWHVCHTKQAATHTEKAWLRFHSHIKVCHCSIAVRDWRNIWKQKFLTQVDSYWQLAKTNKNRHSESVKEKCMYGISGWIEADSSGGGQILASVQHDRTNLLGTELLLKLL